MNQILILTKAQIKLLTSCLDDALQESHKNKLLKRYSDIHKLNTIIKYQANQPIPKTKPKINDK